MPPVQRRIQVHVHRLAASSLALLIYAACGPGLPSSVPLGGVASTSTSERRPPASPGGAGAPASATSDEDDVEGEDDDAGEDAGETFVVSAEGGTDQKLSDTKKDAGASSPKSIAEQTGCDDSGGSSPSCKPLETGACGAMFGAICHVLESHLKPKVASAVVACLIEKNQASDCAGLPDCLDQALEQACVSEQATTTCKRVLARCQASKRADPWFEQTRCERGLSALTEPAFKAVSDCLDTSCDARRCLLELAKP